MVLLWTAFHLRHYKVALFLSLSNYGTSGTAIQDCQHSSCLVGISQHYYHWILLVVQQEGHCVCTITDHSSYKYIMDPWTQYHEMMLLNHQHLHSVLFFCILSCKNYISVGSYYLYLHCCVLYSFSFACILSCMHYVYVGNYSLCHCCCLYSFSFTCILSCQHYVYVGNYSLCHCWFQYSFSFAYILSCKNSASVSPHCFVSFVPSISYGIHYAFS